MCFGGNSANTDRKAQLTGFGNLNDVFGVLKQAGTDLMGQGKGLVSSGKALADKGVADTDKSLKYFSDIMSGNPTAVLGAAAPEINAIAGQTDTAKKTLANNGDRTGGTNAKMQDLSAGTTGMTADLLQKARRDAAGSVASIGESKTRSGFTELGAGLSSEATSVGATEGAGSAAGSLASLAGESRKVSAALHDQAVQQWADAVSLILFGA